MWPQIWTNLGLKLILKSPRLVPFWANLNEIGFNHEINELARGTSLCQRRTSHSGVPELLVLHTPVLTLLVVEVKGQCDGVF